MHCSEFDIGCLDARASGMSMTSISRVLSGMGASSSSSEGLLERSPARCASRRDRRGSGGRASDSNQSCCRRRLEVSSMFTLTVCLSMSQHNLMNSRCVLAC